MEALWEFLAGLGIAIVMLAFLITPATGLVVGEQPARTGDRHALARNQLLWSFVVDRGLVPFLSLLVGVALATQTSAVIDDIRTGTQALIWRAPDGTIAVGGINRVLLIASFATLVVFVATVWLQRPGWLSVRSPQLLLAATRDHALHALGDPGWRADARARLLDIERRRDVRARERLRSRFESLVARRPHLARATKPGLGTCLWLGMTSSRYVWPLALAVLVTAGVTATLVAETGASVWDCLTFAARALLLPFWSMPILLWLGATVPWVRRQLKREFLESAMFADVRRWLRHTHRPFGHHRARRTRTPRVPVALRAQR